MIVKKLFHRNNSGQATIEFILSFSFLLFFVLFFVTVGINLAVGYVAHFAVFKASRHYLTFDNGSARSTVLTQAAAQAQEVFNTFKELNLQGTFSVHSPESAEGQIYEYVGAKFLYQPRIKSIGPFALPQGYQLLSESFLGKEPTRSECKCQVQIALGQGCETEIAPSIEVTVFDNGC